MDDWGSEKSKREMKARLPLLLELIREGEFGRHDLDYLLEFADRFYVAIQEKIQKDRAFDRVAFPVKTALERSEE